MTDPKPKAKASVEWKGHLGDTELRKSKQSQHNSELFLLSRRCSLLDASDMTVEINGSLRGTSMTFD